MGQLSNNKYHITDDGKVYRINEDGSFSEIVDITKLPSDNPKRPWFVRNHNWLWLLGFLAWLLYFVFLSLYAVLARDNTDSIIGIGIDWVIGVPICGVAWLIVYIITWTWSKKRKNNFITNFTWWIISLIITYGSMLSALLICGEAISYKIYNEIKIIGGTELKLYYIYNYCLGEIEPFIVGCILCAGALSLWALAWYLQDKSVGSLKQTINKA